MKTKDAWSITRNTIFYNVAFFIVGTVIAILLAVLISEMMSKRASRLYQTIILLPYLMSWVVISYLAFDFYHRNPDLSTIQFFRCLVRMRLTGTMRKNTGLSYLFL